MNYFTEADFNKLWKAETDERSTLPFPTDKELVALEKRLGVKLPASYIELAANSQNGGYLKRNGVPIRDESGNVFRHVKISYINPIGRVKTEPVWDKPRLFYDTQNLLVIGTNDDTYYEFFVLNYIDCGPEGEPTVVFITRRSKRGDESEPKSGDWRYINELFYWEIVNTVAPAFAEFVKQLVVMPKLPPFDFTAIKEPLKQAAQESFRQIIKAYGQEDIISFGLYVDSESTMVADAANIKAHLEKHIAEFPSEKDYYTYSTNEWFYEGTPFALHLFEPICRELSIHSSALGTENKINRFRNKLIDLCVEVLAELKADGFFAKEYDAPILLSVSVATGEMSLAKIKKIRAILA
ncbi:MAG: DUF4303 domain-containing protein [Sporomusaceae bacterium]|nr:DUF4303 domain-containing protein [Sporomusaceae bacterium]